LSTKVIVREAPAASTPDAAQLCAAGRDAVIDGKFRTARRCFERALALAPDWPEAVWGLAETLHIVGDTDRALELYRRYLTLGVDRAAAEHMIAALGGAPTPARAPDEYVAHVFDEYAPDFDRDLVEQLEYRGPELLRDALAAALPEARDLDVLDLGCGTGLAGVPLRPRARTLVGVDLSAEMLKRASARGIYDALARAEMAAFLAARRADLDLVAAADAFCYVGDLGPVFRAAAGALRPGGHLAFTVERRKGRGWRLLDSGRYAHSVAWIGRTARAAGLREIHRSTGTLRLEAGDPVEAYVSVMRRVV
jgi:predicted TPR repeat methyltransferase